MMKKRLALALAPLAVASTLVACHRGEPTTTARSDTAPVTAAPESTNPPPTTGTSAAATSGSTTAAAGGYGSVGTSGTAAADSGKASTTPPLPGAEQRFLTQAAEGGKFEVEVGRLALDKASDPAVKSFAQMLVDDHGAANDKLRQIAGSHGVALPGVLPADKRQELDKLSKLSGAEFDRQFVKMVGIRDHHHDIDDFRKAGQQATTDDVKSFAQSTLPTLQKHLAAAEKLPANKG